jgi:hypothetical protein
LDFADKNLLRILWKVNAMFYRQTVGVFCSVLLLIAAEMMCGTALDALKMM